MGEFSTTKNLIFIDFVDFNEQKKNETFSPSDTLTVNQHFHIDARANNFRFTLLRFSARSFHDTCGL